MVLQPLPHRGCRPGLPVDPGLHPQTHTVVARLTRDPDHLIGRQIRVDAGSEGQNL